MPFKVTFRGVVTRGDHVESFEAVHLAYDRQTPLHWLVNDLVEATDKSPATRTWPKLVLTGTVTMTVEREPSAGYQDTMERLKEKQRELARQEGIVEIAPEGS